jgi:release factor glutamine methyltransferase
VATLENLFQVGKFLLNDFPHPSSEAKLLLLKAGSIEEKEFLLSPNHRLSRKQERDFFQLIAKRLAGFPLAYLTGTKEFWSISFEVFPGVLIPRPETELIVEKVVEFSSNKEETIVDIGTGCGNIAVSLTKELPQAQIIATDISQKALKVARLNAAAQLNNRITFVRGNLFSPLQRLNLERKCDFIVSNPPYVSEREWEGLSPQIKYHEPKKALVAGETGLEVLEKIIRGSPVFLKPGGFLVLEIGEGQRGSVEAFFDSKWKKITCTKDLNGIPRIVVAQQNTRK